MPTVNLSPLGGAASQFLDNNGVILSGGKIYTYAAGTTTPQVTYTSAAGTTPHANPIILDSAGRVPGGEIWLTRSLVYKFTIETSTGVLLGTYDNISGINAIQDNASTVEYDPPYTGAVTSGYTVQDKLAQYVSIKDFPVVGNGVTDDYATIQQAINQVPIGATLLFDGRPYFISRSLVVNRTINIDFANSELILGPNTFPLNHHLDINSTFSSTTAFTGAVTLGTKTFTVTAPSIAVGDFVQVELGVDPYDANEQHWVRMCRVLANTGSAITIDCRVPYNINGTNHVIRKVDSLVANCTFKNLVLSYTTGTPDTHIFPSSCFNITFENITAEKARILFNPFDCRDMVFRNIHCTTIKAGVSSHGRFMTAWQMENALIENITATCEDSSGGFFFESWARNIEVKNVCVSSNMLSGTDTSSFITGGSYDIRFDGYTVDIQSGIDIFAQGGGVASWTAKNLRLLSYPLALNLNNVSSFDDVQNSLRINEANTPVTTRLEIAMQPSWTDHVEVLCRGVVKNIWVYVQNKAQLSGLLILNSNNNGLDVVTSLTNGQWVRVNLGGFYGSDYPFNNPSYFDKKLSFYTTASMTPGTLCTVVVEYWPVVGANNYLFPPEMSV